MNKFAHSSHANDNLAVVEETHSSQSSESIYNDKGEQKIGNHYHWGSCIVIDELEESPVQKHK